MSGHVDSATLELTGDGSGIEQATAFEQGRASDSLGLHLLRVNAGASGKRGLEPAEEVLFVLSGRGTLRLEAEAHPLGPETAAYIRAGEQYELEADGAEPLVLVSVTALGADGEVTGPRQVVSDLADQEATAATSDREFRLLMGPHGGCGGVTQFVGVAPQGRAPDHYHHYDELIYVLDGDGVLHLDEERTPIGPGSCIHLAPRQVHCLESTSPGGLRLIGVFTPALSPAEAYYPDGTPAPVDS